MSESKRRVFAAGTVCYRRAPIEAAGDTTRQAGSPHSSETQLLVLLVHRSKHRDVSFPKGKLEQHETMPQAAVRETHEETGLTVTLGAHLGSISYQLPTGSEKLVQYWASEVTEQTARAATFTPNSEIAKLEWVPVTEVPARLSHAADRKLFRVFTRLLEHRKLDTFSVILLRHAKAEPRSSKYPEDHKRPLASVGNHQAQTLVPTLAAFGATRVISSTATRCLHTVAPLTEQLNIRLKARDELSQDAWDMGDRVGLQRVIASVVRKQRNTILCTHRPVLPDACRELVLVTGNPPGDYLHTVAALPPGGFSVFHFSASLPEPELIAIESYPLKL